MKLPNRLFLAAALLVTVGAGGIFAEQRTVQGSYINVRQDGNFKAPIVTKKLRGDTYTVEHEKDGWARIVFSDGTKGWIYLSTLERPRSEARGQTPAAEPVVPALPAAVKPDKEKPKPPADDKKKPTEARKPEPKPEAKPTEPPGPTVTPGAVSTTKTAEEFYNEAIDLYEKRRYSQALEANRAALAQAPRNSEILNNLANCLFKMGKVEEAVTNWKKALEIAPKSAKICNNLGIAYYQMDQNDRAIEFYQKAILFEPQFADAYYNLASVFGFKGRFKEALDYYRKFLEFTPDKTMRRLTEERIDYCQKQIQAASATDAKKPAADSKKKGRGAANVPAEPPAASAPAPVAPPASPAVPPPAAATSEADAAAKSEVPSVAPKPRDER
jgi:Tfp pilus assembly protein PilF